MKKGLKNNLTKWGQRLVCFTATVSMGALVASCGNHVNFQDSGSSGNGSLGGSPSSQNPGGTGSGSCPLQNVTIPIKVMFVVDTSGSNSAPSTDEGTLTCDPSQQVCAPATDPNKTFRSGSITTFFNTYQSKPNFSWGFEVFSGTSAESYINSSSSALSASFGNALAMQSAIDQFNNEMDGDATPYISALSTTQEALANDPDINSTAAQPPLYYIIFMSDGYPTDAFINGSVDLGMIDDAIESIRALAPNRIFLSSVYYGTINDPNAASTLQNMAGIGKGQFVNADTGSVNSFSIQDLIQIPSSNCE